MKINQLIAPDRVICLDGISSKKRVLEKLSQILALGAIGYDSAEIFNRLIERERLGSTGLGHGVALPHGRYGENTITIGAFVKLNEGIDFDSPDGEPTDLLFALLVPEHHTDEHLQVLATLAGMFSDKDFCAKLRQCSTDEELYQHLSGWAITSAAS
ncbi:MAG: PTS sugar transporter subunit IIA [Gammaproteobacteria bacterium]|nr:PTS sugar transporter subunit IIA [Gammaproteobacteria bacterium]MDH5734986.1 PTS sugar transporter subunit IIA [Gammaproteobacteria bacterium]